MKIAKSKWKAYTAALAGINQRAAREMDNYAAQNGLDDRKALIDYAYALTDKYCAGSSELACQMYDRIAALQGSNVPDAEPAALPEYGEVAKSVNGTLKQSPEGRLIGDSVGRLVKRAGADTMLKNAKRDHAEFAWIPSGDACAFCEAIASRGWQRASNKTVKGDHAEHIHANCRCEFAIRFSSDMDIDGYEPEKLREEYEEAEGSTPQEKINFLRREKAAEERIRQKLANAGQYEQQDYKSVYEKYIRDATPGEGQKIIEAGRVMKNREARNQNLIHKELGGDIIALVEGREFGKKNPDFAWRGALWEEKEPEESTRNAVSQNIRNGIKQIREKPGGIILDMGESEMPIREIHEEVLNRLRRSSKFDCDVILIKNDEIVDIVRYKK